MNSKQEMGIQLSFVIHLNKRFRSLKKKLHHDDDNDDDEQIQLLKLIRTLGFHEFSG